MSAASGKKKDGICQGRICRRYQRGQDPVIFPLCWIPFPPRSAGPPAQGVPCVPEGWCECFPEESRAGSIMESHCFTMELASDSVIKIPAFAFSFFVLGKTFQVCGDALQDFQIILQILFRPGRNTPPGGRGSCDCIRRWRQPGAS